MKRVNNPIKIVFSLIIIITFMIYSQFQSDNSEYSTQEECSANINDAESLELPEISGNDKLINYEGFKISYNPKAKIPRWVAYELTADEVYGKLSRDGMAFRPDYSISYPQADDYDYRNSGWSRGHMAPAGDFKWSKEAINDAFYFTNCCPQNTTLNGGMWNTLEKKIRHLASEYGKVWVVTGPIIGDNIYGTIGKNRIIVPDSFFKAILIKEGNSYHSIAFIMDNCEFEQNMQKCAMSVNKLEKILNLNLFDALDDNIEERVENNYNLSIWNL